MLPPPLGGPLGAVPPGVGAAGRGGAAGRTGRSAISSVENVGSGGESGDALGGRARLHRGESELRNSLALLLGEGELRLGVPRAVAGDDDLLAGIDDARGVQSVALEDRAHRDAEALRDARQRVAARDGVQPVVGEHRRAAGALDAVGAEREHLAREDRGLPAQPVAGEHHRGRQSEARCDIAHRVSRLHEIARGSRRVGHRIEALGAGRDGGPPLGEHRPQASGGGTLARLRRRGLASRGRVDGARDAEPQSDGSGEDEGHRAREGGPGAKAGGPRRARRRGGVTGCEAGEDDVRAIGRSAVGVCVAPPTSSEVRVGHVALASLTRVAPEGARRIPRSVRSPGYYPQWPM